MSITRRLTIGLILVLLTGCATLSSVRAERGNGISRVFDASFEVVWDKTVKATNMLGLGIAESNQQQGYMLAETGISPFSWGEKVAVFIEGIDADHTKVEVVSRKVMTTNVFAYSWQNRILNKVEELLRQ